MVKPILLFAYGNLSRGDDALGPMLLEYVAQNINLEHIELLTDFQLQIEHALDLQHRQLVLFADASVACEPAVAFTELKPERDKSYTTHAMSPAAILDVYQNIHKTMPPPCFLLSIKAEQMELGEGLSAQAQQHLMHACDFVEQLFNKPQLVFWQQCLIG